MSVALRFGPMLACGVVAIAWVVVARAEDPTAAAKEKQQRLDRQFQESLSWYEVSSGRGSGSLMKPQPALRWTNPTRGQEGEPTLILWTDAGRPEALASVYPWTGNLIYECVSLARDTGLTARERGRTVWSPTRAGVTFRDVPDAPVPAATPVARLQQAKAMAERFKVSLVGVSAGRETREEMRLLPRPIYRYDLGAARDAYPDLIDGAVFAFVQGTDPEAVLLIEATRRNGGLVWQYAFGRATTAGVEARLGSSVVWTPSEHGWNDSKLPNIVLGRPLVP